MRCQAILRRCQTLAACQRALASASRRPASISHSLLRSHGNQMKPVPVLLCRCLSSTSASHKVLLPGNVITSHIQDIDMPQDVSFHQLMFSQFDKFKDEPATSEYVIDKMYTYGDVKTNSIKVASALTRLGYRKGDTILIFSTNNIDYTITMLAGSCIGAVVSAANPTFTPEELARQINHSGAIAIFTIPALAQTVKSAIELKDVTQPKDLFVYGEADGFQPFQSLLEDDGQAFKEVAINPKDDIFLLPYSSGTTGLPKGVMLTHHNILANVLQTITSVPVKLGQNVLCLLPLYHIFGMVVTQFGILYSGGHLHYLPKFEPETFLGCLQDRKISMAHLVPPLVLFLGKHPLVAKYDISSLCYIFSGAAPLGKELTVEVEERFSHDMMVIQGYGLTETSPVTNIDTVKTIGSIGNLVCNTFGKIVDLNTGEALGPHEEGEYCIKGPQVMKGYFNNQTATDAMVTPDGWLHTGDIAYYNEDGEVYISDRLKELIKYKGSQVAPAELEAILLGNEYIQDVAVIGVPDEVAGELPRAYVVKKPNIHVTEDDIIKYIEERVSHTKRLRGGVQFIDAVPKTASGKILRRILKQKYLSK